MKMGIIVFPSVRASMYLEALKKFNPYIIETKESQTINDDCIYEEVKNNPQDYWIYTGGGIVGKRLLEEAKLIHMHPGFVPDYKGSTCFYYSLINNGTISVSALFMNEQIDGGKIILQNTYDKIPDGDIDSYVDPYLRAQTLKDVLLKYKKEGKLESTKQIGEGETYYVIHPVLKHIAILKARK